MGRGAQDTLNKQVLAGRRHGGLTAEVEGIELILPDTPPDIGSAAHRRRLEVYARARTGRPDIRVRLHGSCARCGHTYLEAHPDGLACNVAGCDCHEYVDTGTSATDMRGNLLIKADAPPRGPIEDREIYIRGDLHHECCHEEYTNPEAYFAFCQELGKMAREKKEISSEQIKRLHNILEDGMIETRERYEKPGSYKFLVARNKVRSKIPTDGDVIEEDLSLPKPPGYIPTDADGNDLPIITTPGGKEVVLVPAGTRINLWGPKPLSIEQQADAALMARALPQYQVGEVHPSVKAAMDECEPHIDAAVRGNTSDCIARSYAVHEIFRRHGLLPEDFTDEQRKQAMEKAKEALQKLADQMGLEGPSAPQEGGQGAQPPQSKSGQSMEPMNGMPPISGMPSSLEIQMGGGGDEGESGGDSGDDQPSGDNGGGNDGAGGQSGEAEGSGAAGAGSGGEDGDSSASGDGQAGGQGESGDISAEGADQGAGGGEAGSAEDDQSGASGGGSASSKDGGEESSDDPAGGEGSEGGAAGGDEKAGDASSSGGGAAGDDDAESGAGKGAPGDDEGSDDGASKGGDSADGQGTESGKDSKGQGAGDKNSDDGDADGAGGQGTEGSGDQGTGDEGSDSGADGKEKGDKDSDAGADGKGDKSKGRGEETDGDLQGKSKSDGADGKGDKRPGDETDGDLQGKSKGDGGSSDADQGDDGKGKDAGKANSGDGAAAGDGDGKGEAGTDDSSGHERPFQKHRGGDGGGGYQKDAPIPQEAVEKAERSGIDDLSDGELEDMRKRARQDLEADKTHQREEDMRSFRSGKIEGDQWRFQDRSTVQSQRELTRDLDEPALPGEQGKLHSMGRQLGQRLKRLKAETRAPTRRRLTGRLDRRAIPRGMAGDPRIYMRKGFNLDMDLEIDVAIDRSQSITAAGQDANQYRMAKMLAIASKDTKVPMGIFGWTGGNGSARHFIFKERHSDDTRAIDSLFRCGKGGTPTAEAVQFSRARLKTSKAKQKVMIVITDGEANRIDAARAQVNAATKEGIQVIGLAFGCDKDDMDAQFGAGRWRDIADFTEAPKIVGKLIEDVAKSRANGR